MPKTNTFEKGITMREHLGSNPMHDTGVPLQGFKGTPVDQGRGEFGVPIPGTGKVRKQEPAPPACSALTKKGEPCKAYPVEDIGLCVGHWKQLDANRTA